MNVIVADYTNAPQAQHIVELLNCYALDPMGGGEELSEYTKGNLVAELAERPFAFSILAYENNTPVGLPIVLRAFRLSKPNRL